MMKTKLRNCTTSTLQSDLEDIEHLLNTVETQVTAIASQLDEGDMEFFLNTNLIQSRDNAVQAHYRTVFGL